MAGRTQSGTGGEEGRDPMKYLRMRKWLIMNTCSFEWINVVLRYLVVVRVVAHEKGRGGYYGVRGDILA